MDAVLPQWWFTSDKAHLLDVFSISVRDDTGCVDMTNHTCITGHYYLEQTQIDY